METRVLTRVFCIHRRFGPPIGPPMPEWRAACEVRCADATVGITTLARSAGSSASSWEGIKSGGNATSIALSPERGARRRAPLRRLCRRRSVDDGPCHRECYLVSMRRSGWHHATPQANSLRKRWSVIAALCGIISSQSWVGSPSRAFPGQLSVRRSAPGAMPRGRRKSSRPGSVARHRLRSHTVPLHGVLVPDDACTGPVGGDSASASDRKRLEQDRRRPVHHFE